MVTVNLLLMGVQGSGQRPASREAINLPSSKVLLPPLPGQPQRTNSFPSAVALSPDGRYLAILNNGYGTEESDFRQSIAILDLGFNKLADFPDPRLGRDGKQTYFLGLAFSADGKKLYASIASLTDPTGEGPGDTGNGIAVYRFDAGRLELQGFLKIPLAPLGEDKHPTKVSQKVPKGMAVPFPAGLAVIPSNSGEKLLVAENLSDDAILLDTASGEILRRFDLSIAPEVPASYPYGVVTTRDGKRGFCSLWNGSQVAELDLETGQVARRISLLAPEASIAAGSHPTAMLLGPDEKYLYVTLSNVDRVAVVDTATGTLSRLFSTELPGQAVGGSFPEALAQSSDGRRLFVADSSADAVAVFDMGAVHAPLKLPYLQPLPGRERGAGNEEVPSLGDKGARGEGASPQFIQPALGFIPTEWYPTALAVHDDDLLIVTGKGQGTGPNSRLVSTGERVEQKHPYIGTLIHGSVARVSIREAESQLDKLTREVEESNLMQAAPEQIRFASGGSPIRHVIYIIKENRTYDQVFGDLKPGNGDPSLCLYCEDVTPNEHKLARQFGILDNFYDSGEVSGDGHVWSMAAITTDYNERVWQIGYRNEQRTYDFEGRVANGVPLEQNIPDVDEPATGYIWANVARHGLTHRNYGEFVHTYWCDAPQTPASAKEGTPASSGTGCPRAVVRQGDPLPPRVGQPHGSQSPWPWPVPMIARDEGTKPELLGHFDPGYADFRLDYPDQLRVDEFLNEFEEFVRARKEGKGGELPQFVILRVPNDHTAGTQPGMPRPAASVVDNDLAVGRIVEAISHSPYWDDTAILILEDDAQNGADHVDAHRSIAFVISKYSPGSPDHPFVDHRFYTTVSMVRTIEVLLGLPPMNNNDSHAPVMAPLFSGPGNQPPFNADTKNRDNGFIYQMNPPHAPGAKQSARMDFSRADAADAAVLNAILWKDRKGNTPMPRPRHTVFRKQ
jgi:DNA-binding beta-propeller fold protein YncE